MKKLLVGIMVVMFLASTTMVCAASQYIVVKDKKGGCKVIEGEKKTPATIAGPFKTIREAVENKISLCPGKYKPKKELKAKKPSVVEKSNKAAQKLMEKAVKKDTKTKDIDQKLNIKKSDKDKSEKKAKPKELPKKPVLPSAKPVPVETAPGK